MEVWNKILSTLPPPPSSSISAVLIFTGSILSICDIRKYSITVFIDFI